MNAITAKRSWTATLNLQWQWLMALTGALRWWSYLPAWFSRETTLIDLTSGAEAAALSTASVEQDTAWDDLASSDPLLIADLQRIVEHTFSPAMWSTAIAEDRQQKNVVEALTKSSLGSVHAPVVIVSSGCAPSSGIYGLSAKDLQLTWLQGQGQVAQQVKAKWAVDAFGEYAQMPWSNIVYRELVQLCEQADAHP